jgi:hypothetical protein
MYPRIICVALAMFTVVLLPADVDTARRSKPRFKIIERTYDAEPFISVPGIALATRYPDTIEVHGPRDSRIRDIDLHLYGFSHTLPKDLDILLVAPNGRTALVMSDDGSQAISGPITLTLDDDAKRKLPVNGAISGGRYRPANYDEDDAVPRAVGSEGEQGEHGEEGKPGEEGEPGDDDTPGDSGTPGNPGTPGGTPGFVNDDFPPPAPEFGDATRLSTFRGMDPSGPWQLFIRSDGPAAGELTGGWGLTIEVKKRR